MTEQPEGSQPSPKAELQTIEDAVDRPAGSAAPVPDSQLSAADTARDPFEVLAEDFMDRCRRGEPPSIDECVSLNPDYAEQIRELFPTIAAMEQLKLAKQRESGSQSVPGPIGLERLGDLSIVGEIGRGGMGIVYEAVQESLGRRVAVKVLPKQFLLDDKRLRRFRREARTAANLHHTNIVPILGVGEHDGYHYIVMQYIRGVGLDEVVARLLRRDIESAKDADPALTGRAGEVTRVARALLSGEFVPHDRPGSTVSDSGSIASQTPGDTGSSLAGSHDDTPSSSIRAATTIAVDGLSAPGESTSISVDPVPSEARPVPRFGPPYWQSVARIGFQVADALEYAHQQNVLHRDIKPANLLMDSHGVVWVADFGLAKATEQDDVSRSGDIVGTLRYMAPEQVRGEADARSDVYSLGLTLYELLTLRPAHEDAARKRSLLNQSELADPTRPRKINPHIPRDLETIVLKAMAAEPSHRYPSAGELAADFANFLDDRPIRARRVSSAERLWRWCRRNRAVAGLASTALALLVLVAALTSIGYVRAKEANRLIQQAFDGERTQRERAEATLEISLEALDKVARRFQPDQVAAGSSVTVEVDDGEQFDIPSLPAVSKETAAMLEDILPFYDRLAEQYGDNQRLRAASAKAYRRGGDIQQRLGHPAQAVDAYQHAIETYKQLADDDGSENAFVVEAARTCNQLGNVQMAMLDFEQSRASYHDALSLLNKAGNSNDSSPEIRYELARTYYNLDRRGNPGPLPRVGPRGDRHRPADGFRGARSSRSPHLRLGFFPRPNNARPGMGPPRSPDGNPAGDPARPADSEPANDSGSVSGRRHGGSPHWYRNWENMDRAIEILSDLIAKHPASPDYRHLLALCLREKAFGSPIGDSAKAIEMLEEICRDFPNHTGYRFDLCKTLAMLDPQSPRLTLDDLDVGERRLRKALDIADSLAAEYPNEPEYVTAQVDIHCKLGTSLARRAHAAGYPDSGPLLAESERHHRSAVAFASLLADGFPDVVSYAVWYAICRSTLADILSQRGEFYEAHWLLISTISDLRKEIEANPSHRALGWLLVYCYRTHTYVLSQIGDDDLASGTMEKAYEQRGRIPPFGSSSGRTPFGRKMPGRGDSNHRREDDGP